MPHKNILLRLYLILLMTLAGALDLAAQQLPSDIIRLFPLPTERLIGTSRDEVLPVDQAFRFEHASEARGLKLVWQIRPGYYLYRHKIGLRGGQQAISLQLPPGRDSIDEVFGEVQLLEGQVEVLVPGTDLAAWKGGFLQLSYQGCAASGYCYPPQMRRIHLAE